MKEGGVEEPRKTIT